MKSFVIMLLSAYGVLSRIPAVRSFAQRYYNKYAPEFMGGPALAVRRQQLTMQVKRRIGR
jgi:hypothetical protein